MSLLRVWPTGNSWARSQEVLFISGQETLVEKNFPELDTNKGLETVVKLLDL